MFKEQTIKAGLHAKLTREKYGNPSPEYDLAIKRIDMIDKYSRDISPENHWFDKSSEYLALTRKWKKERDARKLTP